MKSYLILLLNLILLSPIFAQEELRLLSSRHSTIIDQKGFSSIQPVYLHKGNTLSADSGIIYEDEIGRQFFEAFGNIVITQPSGTIIYADKLFYDAAPQVATLTNNVRMVDAKSVLTTNHLVYKMREKIGTYTGGGRIISQTDTITSKNAYYFENTQDAYFRNKVIVRTPDVKIYTDTMRYNSDQRMTYFFGPTNIKGNKGENLYTEEGNYNTQTGVANFSKNNLYTEGSRFLKGDSLHYDRETAIGKAYRNVVFVDTVDKFFAHGEYGLYNQNDESITMADRVLITMVVENDSTSSAAPSDSLATAEPEGKKRKKNKKEEAAEELQKLDTGQSDLLKENKSSEGLIPRDSLGNGLAASDSSRIFIPKEQSKVDSVYMTADTLFSKMILLKDYKALDLKLDRSGGELVVDDDVDYGDDENELGEGDEFLADPLAADSTKKLTELNASGELEELAKSIPTEVAELTEKGEEAVTTIKKTKSLPKLPLAKEERPVEKSIREDSLLRQKAIVPLENHADSLISQAMTTAQRPDTAKAYRDTADVAYMDTARTRIMRAYHNVRLFKSDLQAVADSLYYGMADSMFRFMGRPMIWAEESQISADTIYMQIQQQKLDNALFLGNAFMVNALQDSAQFNQLKGRKITAFFKDNSVERLFVDGNAENLGFVVNEKTKIVTEMFHDRGSRIKITMADKKIKDYVTVLKVDQKFYPFKLVTPENEVLPGFVWLPQDRPKSKEDMLNRKRPLEKDAVPTTSDPDSENTGGGKPSSRETAVEIEEEEVEEIQERSTKPSEATKEEVKELEKNKLEESEENTEKAELKETQEESTQ